jgi:hypothetical protein
MDGDGDDPDLLLAIALSQSLLVCVVELYQFQAHHRSLVMEVVVVKAICFVS